jgi:hypothetical protein
MAEICERIFWKPIADGLPDAETNVMLAMDDGTSCEGFCDGDVAGFPVWRDVTADEIEDANVTHWAPMPGGPHKVAWPKVAEINHG